MKWSELKELGQLDEIDRESIDKTILIFKYSTLCPTSRVVFDRLQRNWKDDEMYSVLPYFLDLIRYREISNKVADTYGIRHESPQVIVLQEGKAIYNESHMGIDYSTISRLVKNQTSPTEQRNREG